MPQLSDSLKSVWIQPTGFPPLPQGWVSEWETLEVEGSKLFSVLHHAEPMGNGRVLVIAHGHGEHGGRYLHVPHYLKSVVSAVSITDHRGHGRSEGLRGHAETFDQYAVDFAAAIRRTESIVRERVGKCELHILGHSLGGHIALRTLFLFPDLKIASATISAPFLAVYGKVPAIKSLASRALSRIWGDLEIATGLDAGRVSHDPEVVSAYQKDRLVHDKITPRIWENMKLTWRDTLSRTGGIDVPTQFLIPLADEIVDSEVSLAFAERLDIPSKRICRYEGFFHESLNEVGKDKAFEDIAAWIQEHSRLKP